MEGDNNRFSMNRRMSSNGLVGYCRLPFRSVGVNPAPCRSKSLEI